MVVKLTGGIGYDLVGESLLKKRHRRIKRLATAIFACSLIWLLSNLGLQYFVQEDEPPVAPPMDAWSRYHIKDADHVSYQSSYLYPTFHSRQRRFQSLEPLPSTTHSDMFIYYNVHSGFNNQRVSLENAIIISILLNATLIVPYAQIGEVFPWKPYSVLSTISREFDYVCLLQEETRQTFYGEFDNTSCVDYEELFDFHRVQKVIPSFKWISLSEFMARMGVNHLVFRDFYQYHPQQIERVWAEVVEKLDTIYVQDFDKNAYQLFDSQYNLEEDHEMEIRKSDLREYETWMDIDILRNKNNLTLASQSYHNNVMNIRLEFKSGFWYKYFSFMYPPRSTLVHFGSLFGKDRFQPRSFQQKSLKKLVENNILYSSDTLVKTLAEPIIQKLGGQGSFVGIHLRTQHGIFKDVVLETIEKTTRFLDDCLENRANCSFSKWQLGNQDWHPTVPHQGKVCYYTPDSSIPTKKLPFAIFLATDMPANQVPVDRRLLQLIAKYPCIYTANDFKEDILEELIKIDPLKNYLHYIPFVEQYVAASGFKFFGTRKSTFSQFANRMHSSLFYSEN